MYGHSRNPMYVGNFLILVGVAVASNSRACVLLALPLFGFAYRAIVAAEEQYFRGRFGEQFNAYARDVPRLWPTFQGLGSTLQSCQALSRTKGRCRSPDGCDCGDGFRVGYRPHT
jgi:hypothetical protein